MNALRLWFISASGLWPFAVPGLVNCHSFAGPLQKSRLFSSARQDFICTAVQICYFMNSRPNFRCHNKARARTGAIRDCRNLEKG
jgi:hypothetical protein